MDDLTSYRVYVPVVWRDKLNFAFTARVYADGKCVIVEPPFGGLRFVDEAGAENLMAAVRFALGDLKGDTAAQVQASPACPDIETAQGE